MIQRTVKIEGRLAACPCGKQPKHIQHGFRLHSLECAPCGTSTGRFGTFGEAVAAWESRETAKYVKAA